MFEFAFAAAAALQAGPAISPDWRWNQQSLSCSATQDAGGGRKLGINRTPGTDLTSVTIEDAGPGTPGSQQMKLAVTLQPGGSSSGEGYVAYNPRRGRRLTVVNIDGPAFLRRLSNASALTVRGKKFGEVTVDVRSADSAVQAIRQCDEGRMRAWGMNPGTWYALQSRPRLLPDKDGLLRASDYPPALAQAGVRGRVVVRLTVGVDGRAKDCVNVLANSNQTLVNLVCTVARERARFAPAVSGTAGLVEAPYIVAAEIG